MNNVSVQASSSKGIDNVYIGRKKAGHVQAVPAGAGIKYVIVVHRGDWCQPIRVPDVYADHAAAVADVVARKQAI